MISAQVFQYFIEINEGCRYHVEEVLQPPAFNILLKSTRMPDEVIEKLWLGLSIFY